MVIRNYNTRQQITIATLSTFKKKKPFFFFKNLEARVLIPAVLHFLLENGPNLLHEHTETSSSTEVKTAAHLFLVAMATPSIGAPLMWSL